MSFEIVEVRDERASDFLRAHEREALRTFYGFPVVWHEQRHDLTAIEDGDVVGALRARIAASLAEIESVVVDPAHRRRGVGRALLERTRELASYYNCHKITLEVPHGSTAQAFFEACGYREEAVLPQHIFKLDVAVMRTFLL